MDSKGNITMKNEVKHDHLKKFDPHSLLIAATRYYVGRMTIGSCAFAQELASAWPEIPEDTKGIIRRDLERDFDRDDEARKRGDEFLPLGADCDRAGWELVRAAWSKEAQP
jgi:hypothetical protein